MWKGGGLAAREGISFCLVLTRREGPRTRPVHWSRGGAGVVGGLQQFSTGSCEEWRRPTERGRAVGAHSKPGQFRGGVLVRMAVHPEQQRCRSPRSTGQRATESNVGKDFCERAQPSAAAGFVTPRGAGTASPAKDTSRSKRSLVTGSTTRQGRGVALIARRRRA